MSQIDHIAAIPRRCGHVRSTAEKSQSPNAGEWLVYTQTRIWWEREERGILLHRIRQQRAIAAIGITNYLSLPRVLFVVGQTLRPNR